MLNVSNIDDILRISNRNKLITIYNLKLNTTSSKIINFDCDITYIDKFIHFKIKDIDILPKGNYNYIITADGVEIDRGILKIY